MSSNFLSPDSRGSEYSKDASLKPTVSVPGAAVISPEGAFTAIAEFLRLPR